jgi:adenine phosphoribosyltransferase
MNLRDFIRIIPDFPKPGIMFNDITPLLLNPTAYSYAISQLADYAPKTKMIAGIESRGFLFAAPVAQALQLPLTILRKPGKLPYKTYNATYALEYGEAEIQVHQDVPKEPVLIIDDVLATGGTAQAACKLLEQAGCQVVGCAFLIDLGIGGREKLTHDVFTLIRS